MPKILLVKTSSMGDVIHNLPIVSDIRRHYPSAEIDWVVEESFREIPAMHPGIRKTISVAARRWRKSWYHRETGRELQAFKAVLKNESYDTILDTQGLLKSALITRTGRGKRCGYSRSSAREPVAARFYDAVFDVPKSMHAVERNRALAALALGYKQTAATDYGLRIEPLTTGHRYAVLLHATSRADKEWGEASWLALGHSLNASGIEVLLPWGSEAERLRSEHLKASLMNAFVPSRMPLAKLAELLASAAIVIGADTGLTHLAVALGRRTIGIYCGSDPRLTGLYGGDKVVNLGNVGAPPSVAEVTAAAEKLLA